MEEKKEQIKTPNLKVLRTYSSDMADAVRTNEMSVIKIALAEKDRREQEEVYKKVEGSKTSKVLFAIGGIILIGAAIWGSTHILEKKKVAEDLLLTKNQAVDTFINYDNSSFIDVTEVSNVVGMVSAIKAKLPEDEKGISALFFTKKIGIGNERIDKDIFLSILKTTAPGSLIRSLGTEFLLGKYSNKEAIVSRPSMFLVFKINDYSLAYASMLDWEKSMFRDLFVLFDINISDSDNALFEKSWKDIIISNKDARVLYGENGEGVLFYSFVNKDRLIITKDSDTLKEIISQILVKNDKS